MPGVRILYISPLKALNEDIRRNLDVPLAGILEKSQELGCPLSPLQVAVRSGDTSDSRPGPDRPQAARHPDHDARIAPPDAHQPGARGPAERLARDRRRDPLGLRQQARGLPGPLARAARGDLAQRPSSGSACRRRSGRSTRWPATWAARGSSARSLRNGDSSPGPSRSSTPAGARRWTFEVLWPGPDEGRFLGPPGSIWPAIEERIVGLASGHRSTIIFANNRRTVEKLDGPAQRAGRDRGVGRVRPSIPRRPGSAPTTAA